VSYVVVCCRIIVSDNHSQIHHKMKTLFTILFLFIAVSSQAQQLAKINSKGHYSISSDSSQTVKAVNTGKTFEDKKGVVYPIFKSGKGKFFIVRTSAKTGNTYKQYLTIN